MLDSPNAEPSPLVAAQEAREGGADSITLHVRGDRRHIQEEDAFAIREGVDLPLNLEMAAVPEMIELAARLKPDYVCLVPENRAEITTEGGLGVVGQEERLRDVVGALREHGALVSLFIDAEVAQVTAAAATGAAMIELHTGCFANAAGQEVQDELSRLQQAARLGVEVGLQVNAGHGINYKNITEVLAVKAVSELNIGHSIVSRAVSVGMRQAVVEMRELMVAGSQS